MKLVDLVAIHVEAGTGLPVLILREHDAPHRLLPILIGASEAAAIAVAATGYQTERPLTHDVMAEIVERLDARLDTVEVTDLENGTFHADLTLTTPDGVRHVDSRPSDAIALAVRLHAPMFVSDGVLDEAGTASEIDVDSDHGPDIDESFIDAEVARFRAELAELNDLDDVTDVSIDPDEDRGEDAGGA